MDVIVIVYYKFDTKCPIIPSLDHRRAKSACYYSILRFSTLTYD